MGKIDEHLRGLWAEEGAPVQGAKPPAGNAAGGGTEPQEVFLAFGVASAAFVGALILGALGYVLHRLLW